MMRFAGISLVLLFVAGVAVDSASARERRSKPSNPAPAPVVVITDPQDPVDWMTDAEAAFKLAAEEKRALLILVTTEDTERSTQSCRFGPNPTRKAVRESKVVPLKLLPPMALDTAGLTPEEVKKRQEAFQDTKKRYEELLKRYAVTTAPTLIYAAPDGAKLQLQNAPSDEDIRSMLSRLPDLVKIHQEAVAKGDKKPEPVVAKDPPAKVAPPAADPKPVETPKPPVKKTEDDF